MMYREIFMDLKVSNTIESLLATDCPGDIMELFEVQKCSNEDGVIYIKDQNGVEDVGTLSKKDNDKWHFLLDYASELYFKCFSDCLPKNSTYWWETYRVGYFAVKVTNNAIVDKIREACMCGDYSFRTHKFKEFHGMIEIKVLLVLTHVFKSLL